MRETTWTLAILRILGVTLALASWYAVLFNRPQSWRESRAPLSPASKVVVACSWTAWCLAAWHVFPLVFAGVFGISALTLFVLARRDRRRYAVYHGWPHEPALTNRQAWILLCVADALLLFVLLIVFVRDIVFPPASAEQLLVHNLGLVMAALAALGGIALYLTHPRKSE